MRAEDGKIIDFQSQKRERIVTGTQEALQTIKDLLEEHALKVGFAAVDELTDNLTELAELNGYLLELIEFQDLLQELQLGLTAIYEVTSRREAFQLEFSDIGFIKTSWRSYKDTIFAELIDFATRIKHIGETYCENKDGNPHGEEWMIELVQRGREIDKALDELSLRPLRESILELYGLIRKYLVLVNSRLQKTVTTLSTLTNELLAMARRYGRK
jgi:hypothetical protein